MTLILETVIFPLLSSLFLKFLNVYILITFFKLQNDGQGCGSVIECLFTLWEILGLIPSITKGQNSEWFDYSLYPFIRSTRQPRGALAVSHILSFLKILFALRQDLAKEPVQGCNLQPSCLSLPQCYNYRYVLLCPACIHQS